MVVKDVLIIGAGISGCAVALALAKKGIPVAIVTSSKDRHCYHAPFIQKGELEEKLKGIQLGIEEQSSCLRAADQLVSYARKSIEELLGPIDAYGRYGNIDVHKSLQEQLLTFPNVEWISNHTLVELLTLHQHSTRQADLYKNQACLGAVLFNNETKAVESILAKEVILATGGAASLYPFTTHDQSAIGEGLAIAYRAGARLVNMGHVHFHPLCLFEKNKSCFPLPLELLQEGGQLLLSKNMPVDPMPHDGRINEWLYDQIVKNRGESLGLNLTMLDSAQQKERYPYADAYCMDHGYNLAKDILPIVPAARMTCGGIAVDRYGQSSIQRLRAIGMAACTGLIYGEYDEAMHVLESLTWALACADDMEKHLSRFIYYFPDVKEVEIAEGAANEEDWQILKQVMWHYLGIKRIPEGVKTAVGLLEQLQKSAESPQLKNALQAALLIGRAVEADLSAVKPATMQVQSLHEFALKKCS